MLADQVIDVERKRCVQTVSNIHRFACHPRGCAGKACETCPLQAVITALGDYSVALDRAERML
jgi:hypothetical protein